MASLKTIFLAIFAVICVTYGAAAFSYHDNKVKFSVSGYSIKSASFKVTSHSVTSGQDPDNKIQNNKSIRRKSGSFSFRVGRKGSSKVAKWFNARISKSRTTFNHSAGKLNFAMIGDLKIRLSGGDLHSSRRTFTFKDVAFAQGRTGSRNNWWFGGKKCKNQSGKKVRCIGTDSKGTPVAFTFRRGGNSVNSVDVTKVSLVDTRNWMAHLSDTTTLNKVMMPGSHDAGLSTTAHCSLSGVPVAGSIIKVLSKTQSIEIDDQLEAGFRYFDLRVDYDHDELVTYHRQWGSGKGCNGQPVEEILKQVKTFLSKHSKETVILKFSKIRGKNYGKSDKHKASTKDKLKKLLQKSTYRSMLYDFGSRKESTVNLATREIRFFRGRVLAVFDYSTGLDSREGRFRYRDGCKYRDPNVTVCDKYSNTDKYSTMKKGQLANWKKYGGQQKDYLYLLSWTLTSAGLDENLRLAVADYARVANRNLSGVLFDEVPNLGKPNIVYLDFASEALGQLIAQHNFR